MGKEKGVITKIKEIIEGWGEIITFGGETLIKDTLIDSGTII